MHIVYSTIQLVAQMVTWDSMVLDHPQLKGEWSCVIIIDGVLFVMTPGVVLMLK